MMSVEPTSVVERSDEVRPSPTRLQISMPPEQEDDELYSDEFDTDLEDTGRCGSQSTRYQRKISEVLVVSSRVESINSVFYLGGKYHRHPQHNSMMEPW